jgi:hypothetical protein
MYDLRRLRVNTQGAPSSLGCEKWKNLFLKTQFREFIIELGSEIELLEHLLQCEICKTGIQRLVEKDECVSNERWSNLFLKDLPDRYEPFNDAVSVYYGDCPRFEDYRINIESFIEDRIKWRIHVIEKILKDAEVELEEISKPHNY